MYCPLRLCNYANSLLWILVNSSSTKLYFFGHYLRKFFFNFKRTFLEQKIFSSESNLLEANFRPVLEQEEKVISFDCNLAV